MATTLGFPDTKNDGRYPVTDTDARPVAQLDVSWTGVSFAAEAPDGSALCTGKRRSMFSRSFDVADPNGAALASLRAGWSGRVAIELAGREALTVRGSWGNRDWTATDSSGRVVLSATAQSSSWSLHPDAYAVTCEDESLDLATFVGVVQTYRLITKNRRGGAVAAAGAAGAG